jgi:alpha-amylase
MTRHLVAAVLAAALAFGGCDLASPTTPISGVPATPATAPPVPSRAAGCTNAAALTPGVPPPTSGAWSGRVFYEVFVRSFSDSNGDGIGDLDGLSQRLDYLNDGDPATTTDLGVTGIWLMPVAEAASYHGYDVTDYAAVERDYGDRAAIRRFIESAHERGVAVIVDFVINHTSREHPWFRDALDRGPHRDWYSWSDENPHWPAVAGPSPWHESPNGDFFYGAFWDGMPDLNLRNAEVTAEIRRIAEIWLDEIGVDGFRIDAAKHLIEVGPDEQLNTSETLAWLQDFTTAVHEDHPDALVIGEVWDVARTAGGYVPASSDLTFDFGMADAVISALQNGRTPPISTALGETTRFWPPNRAASFLTNHDQDRVVSQLNGDVAAAKLAAFMLLTGPGVPFVYYGEEIGMQGQKPDERIRTPMQWAPKGPGAGFSTVAPWEPLADDWATVNVASQAADPESLLATYRSAIALRAAHPALGSGATTVVDGGSEAVTAWLRVADDETLLAVVNVRPEPVTDYALSLASGSLCGVIAAEVVASIGGASVEIAPPTLTDSGGLDGWVPMPTLAPRSGYLLRLDRE